MITQPVAIIITVALFALAFGSFWFFNVRDDSGSWVTCIGMPLLLLIVALGSLFWSLNDNFYHVQSGVVINQSFEPAHQNPPIIISSGKSTTIVPGAWVPDDWAVEVRDKHGVTGWFHFSQDALSRYPIGSNYP